MIKRKRINPSHNVNHFTIAISVKNNCKELFFPNGAALVVVAEGLQTTDPTTQQISLHLALNINTLRTVGSPFTGGSSPEYWLINPTDNPGRIKSTHHCNQLTASLWDIMVWIQRSMHGSLVHTAAYDIKT